MCQVENLDNNEYIYAKHGWQLFDMRPHSMVYQNYNNSHRFGAVSINVKFILEMSSCIACLT